MNQPTYHIPVLRDEVLAYLAPKPGGTYLDVTFGGGGHTRAILESQSDCKVVALDWDKQALEQNAPPIEAAFSNRFKAVWANFAQVLHVSKREKFPKFDGILADFGTSMEQLKRREGFSFSTNTFLDMRQSPAHQHTTAATIVNHASAEELAMIFFRYSEEPRSRAAARAIVAYRAKKAIKTTFDLIQAIQPVVGEGRPQGIHPATRIFQALRIAVNKELENIESFLTATSSMLAPGGRLVCISFHSLEDRIVKQFLKDRSDQFTVLTKHVITASDEELARNNAARSARLRAAEYTTGVI